MQTGTSNPVHEFRVGGSDAEARVRQALGQADVSRVTVYDTHGHTIVEVPVRPDEVAQVMEPVVAATKAVADTVGEVVLRVESEPELPATGGSVASGRERARAGAQAQAYGTELEGAAQSSDVEQARASMGVTQQDAQRIRDANQVPAAQPLSDRRIPPEQMGEPDLKDTDTPYAATEKKPPKPSR